MFAGDAGADPALNAVAEAAFDTMRSLGATLVDPIEPVDTKAIADAELTVLFSEFKVSMAAYLGGLRGTAMRTLADLIAFNDAHCEDELRWFGQELFDVAEATTGLDDPAYRAARALCLDATRARWDRPDPGRWPPRRDRGACLRRLDRRRRSPATRASRSRPA